MRTIHDTDFQNLVGPRKGVGPLIHFGPLDMIIGGMPNRLVTIAGFSGSFKTTFALNIAYNNAVKLGWTVALLSLEMDPDDLMLRLLVMHSHEPKFDRYHLSIKINDVEQNYNNLSSEAKDFLFNTVAEDLKKNCPGELFVVSLDDLGKAGGLDLLLFQLDNMSKRGVNLLIVDYIQLLSRVIRMNGYNVNQFQFVSDVARYCKMLTQTPRKGEVFTVILLSQINRTSFLAAKDKIKNSRIASEQYDYLYELTSISESSEIVAASDIVIALYADDQTKGKRNLRIQLLKNRRGETNEKGVDALCIPEICYVGDVKRDEPPLDPDYIHDLLTGKL